MEVNYEYNKPNTIFKTYLKLIDDLEESNCIYKKIKILADILEFTFKTKLLNSKKNDKFITTLILKYLTEFSPQNLIPKILNDEDLILKYKQLFIIFLENINENIDNIKKSKNFTNKLDSIIKTNMYIYLN